MSNVEFAVVQFEVGRYSAAQPVSLSATKWGEGWGEGLSPHIQRR
jgi:hypothetical protein